MRTIAVSKFKAHALGILEDIATTHEPLVITKRGKPFISVTPYQATNEQIEFGKLANTVVNEGDIVSPLGSDIWESA